MIALGVNIDHIATLRQQRQPSALDILYAAQTAESAGADSIVVHLREDRRHIQDEDVRVLRRRLKTRLNLEMSFDEKIVRFAARIKPDQATLVPEKRRELTTEGGLDVVRLKNDVARAVEKLDKKNIPVSLFIEPDVRQIRAAHAVGVARIELHTGRYANSRTLREVRNNLDRIKEAVHCGRGLGLVVSAGHGLDYDNVCAIAGLPCIHELNIGYSIISYAIFFGLDVAVRRMKQLIQKG
jgi:pyridoxine 5-phosphate synthase